MCQCQGIINWYVKCIHFSDSVPLCDSSTVCSVNSSSAFSLDFTKFTGINWILCFVIACFSRSLSRWVFCSSALSLPPSHQQFKEAAEKSCPFQEKITQLSLLFLGWTFMSRALSYPLAVTSPIEAVKSGRYLRCRVASRGLEFFHSSLAKVIPINGPCWGWFRKAAWSSHGLQPVCPGAKAVRKLVMGVASLSGYVSLLICSIFLLLA